MRIGKLSLFFAVAMIAYYSAAGHADQGVYTYSGGSFATGTAVGAKITVTGAPMSATGATLSFSCPITSYAGGTYALNWTCAGGSVTIATPDKSLIFAGSFDSGSMSFSGSGGGKGGHVTYYYSFSGAFSGTVTAAGVTQGAHGSLSQYVKTTSQTGSGAVTGGSFGWNSAYSPILAADNSNGRIVAADNITGANLSAYGAYGNGTGQFETISGLTEDASGRIYVVDSALSRLARIDNLTGKNWVELGSAGTGTNHFNAPAGVAIDAAGKIWVADTGNNRIVRMDDMSGTNWTSFGTAGTGANQFSGPTSIAFDASGRIYVTDAGNNRLVRFDDLTGKNWVSLSEVLIDPYGYPFYSARAVAIDAAGKIYVATGASTGYLIRCDDMTGANPVVSLWSGGLTSISLDKAGTIYVTSGLAPGLAQVENAAAAGYYASALGAAVTSPGVVYARPSATPTPAAGALSVASLTFASQNVGEPSAAQAISLTNLGAAGLSINGLSLSPDFKLTANNCPHILTGGASCTGMVAFDPKAAGPRTGELTVALGGVHPSLGAALTGIGTQPTAVVTPGTLTFAGQALNTASAAQTLTLSNAGSGPLAIASIAATGAFSQSNNCGAGLMPGTACTISVAFKPSAAGAQTGAVTITDDATPPSTHQTVTLSGTGATVASLLTLTPASLAFPEQLAGSSSGSQALVLKNGSAAAIAPGAASFPAGFKGTTNCGASLAKGASCSYSVIFAPTAAGAASGTISVPIAGQTALTAEVSGTGVAAGQGPVLAANPMSLDFGQITYGDNPSLSATITNSARVATAIQSHSFVGDPSLTVTNYTCPAILTPGASCAIEITFQPVAATPFNVSGTITFTEGSGATMTVLVTGQAVANGGM